MKRLGIFVFYNKYGKVGEYIDFLLKEMMEFCNSFLIVSNVKVNPEGMSLFKKYTDNIYIRKNQGCDAGAYKFIFSLKLDKKISDDYDDILIFNDTFYGPLFPLTEVFEEMGKRDCDFWGITGYNGWKNIPYHIQSYFVNFKNKILKSDSFWEYWEKLDTDFQNPLLSMKKFELTLTRYFEERGFKSDTYIHSNYCGIEYMDYPFEMIAEKKFPFIKKKIFSEHPYQMSKLISIRRTFKYMLKNNYFNADMAIKDLLAIYDIRELKKAIGLNLIVKDTDEEIDENKNVYVISDKEKEFFFRRIKTIVVKRFDEKLDLRTKPLLICSKTSVENNKDNMFVFENILKNQKYVQSILKFFEEYNRLGCILPSVNTSEYSISNENNIFSNYGFFWIRANVLEEILKSENIKVEALSQISGEEIAHFVQKYGFLTATAETEEYALTRMSMNENILSELIFHLSNNFNFNSLTDVIEKLHGDRLHIKRIQYIINNKLRKYWG